MAAATTDLNDSWAVGKQGCANRAAIDLVVARSTTPPGSARRRFDRKAPAPRQSARSGTADERHEMPPG